MAVEQRNRRHGEGEDAAPEGVQAVGPEAGGPARVVEVEAVGVEFLDAGGGEDDAFWVAEFEDVEGEEEGVAEGLGWVSWRSCGGWVEGLGTRAMGVG